MFLQYLMSFLFFICIYITTEKCIMMMMVELLYDEFDFEMSAYISITSSKIYGFNKIQTEITSKL